jgi:Mrp family chromosome partitioning ATPase
MIDSSSAQFDTQGDWNGEASRLPEKRSLLPILNEYIRGTEFKRLMNQIAVAQSRMDFKSLAVLSEYPGEGRTFFVAAMALAYAKYLPSRVLIVDTASRGSGQLQHFQCVMGMHLPQTMQSKGLIEPGVVDLVAMNEKQAPTADHSDFQIRQYIASLQDRYDLVIVDTCALSSVSRGKIDPVIVAQHVDTSILITSELSLERETLARIKRRLQRYGIEPLGTVFNTGIAL